MRLIDADALREKRWDADTRVGYVQVVDVGDIDDAPTIEPCQHGEWIRLIGHSAPLCSVCYGYAVETSGHFYYRSDYCPNCGAKMDVT